jgi:UMF1 family MFS transporter
MRSAAPSGAARTDRAALAGWVLYDIAIHGYGLMIPGVAYAIYFTSYVAVDGGRADVLWSVAVALPLLIAGLVSPWLGAIADATGRRRALLVAATLGCGLASALLVTVKRGDVAAGIALFVIAQACAMVAQSLYNSFLPLLSRNRDTARLSGFAWGLSYVGGIACFLLCLPFTRGGLSDGNAAAFANAFLVTAAFLLAIGLPAALMLPASPRQPGATHAGAGAYRRIWATIRGWKRDREVPKLLLAFYLVNDAIVTVIYFTAVMLNRSFGLDVQEVLMLSLAFQAIAIPATMFFGWLGGRWSQRGAINVSLLLWAVVLALMAFAQGHAGALAIAASLGLVLGSTQSLFRSLFAQMVPADRASEYFGFHALAGRASSALGPILFGIVAAATGSQRWAMASLAIFFAAGAIVLAAVRVPQDLRTKLQPT